MNKPDFKNAVKCILRWGETGYLSEDKILDVLYEAYNLGFKEALDYGWVIEQDKSYIEKV